LKEIIEKAHQRDIPVVIDGAQAAPHTKIDVQELDCDFYCFSGHKVFGPTGIGALYGKMEWLEKMPPYMGGGEMIDSVTFEKTTFGKPPFKFEAGTPNIADAVALKYALQYVEDLGFENIQAHENNLLAYATERLSDIDELKFIGEAKNKASVISFILKDIHPGDLGMILDKMGVAVRIGNHCTEPIMKRFGIYRALSELPLLFTIPLKRLMFLLKV
jgi:cysteine desulfurase/selenocysteine lyase